MGDAIAANLFILGYAWQQGLVPISFDALMRAIELNGAAVDMNKTAFAWGRLAAIDMDAVVDAAGIVRNAPTVAEATPHALPLLGATPNEAAESGLMPQAADLRDEDALRHVPASGTGETAFAPLDDARLSRSLDEVIARRVAFLTGYQNANYAKRYSDFVAKVRAAETAKAPGSTALSEAVARYFFKLMAYKDEYEVARLYTSGDFRRKLEAQFEGDYKLHFHLAPPLLARKNAQGQLQKKAYGPWVFTAFRVLAKLRALRGTPLDLFGYTAERRSERALIGEYEKTVAGLLDKLDAGNAALAADIASIPEHIRGYGHVKEAHLHKAKARQAELLREWDNPLRIVQAG
jgi:indolepyruvate ferredoxin oxidoreductase